MGSYRRRSKVKDLPLARSSFDFSAGATGGVPGAQYFLTKFKMSITLSRSRPTTPPGVSHEPKPKRRFARPGRAKWEFYPTPPEAVRALLSVESFDGGIWEPACGNGAISRELEVAGYDVVSTDITDHGYGQSGHDFLKSEKPLAKHIITNPPYGTHGLADSFVRKALIHTRKTGGSVAMLLNLRSLCNPVRHAKFIKTPPSAIYVIDQLICWPEGRETSRDARIAKQQYYWAVWKPGHTGAPKFWWLSAADFRERT